MASEIRESIFKTMELYRSKLKPDNKGWKVLEVGIDGDSRPGGNYKYFGVGNDYKTLDVLERLNPDFVADICHTNLPGGEWDLIIISQTLEHVFDFRRAIEECHRLLKDGGFLILDCPFKWEYHGQPDYEDYWRISHKAMQRILNEIGFEYGNCRLVNDILTSAIARKARKKV